MIRLVVLDSSPLGLLFQRRKIPQADDCRAWLKRHADAGTHFIVPEIVNYELRREPLRLGKAKAIRGLELFNHAVPDRYLPITTKAMDLAAALWADARRRGLPTAHVHELDVDVILAAQILAAGWRTADFVVATTNVTHLARFVPAEKWANI